MKSISLSKSFFVILIFAAFIPAAFVTNFSLGFAYFNAASLSLYCLFVVVCASYPVCGMNKKGAMLFLPVVALFVFSILISIFILNRDITTVLRQVESYLPFIIATALIASNIRFDKKIFETYLFYTIAWSALAALLLYFVGGNFLQVQMAKYNEGAAHVIGAGRMYWDGGALALIALFLYFVQPSIRKNKLSVYAAAVIVVAVLATQNRTLALALALLAIYFSVARLRALLAVCVFGMAIYLLFSFMPQYAQDLFAKRFFLSHGGAALQHAFELGRVPLYIQYWDLIKSFPVFGIGLGVPFAYSGVNGVGVYTSDVSLVSFMIPFGLFGFITVVFYWGKIFFRIVNKRDLLIKKYRRHLLVFALLALGVSFNIDIISRNLFVVIFTAMLFNVDDRPRLLKVRVEKL